MAGLVVSCRRLFAILTCLPMVVLAQQDAAPAATGSSPTADPPTVLELIAELRGRVTRAETKQDQCDTEVKAQATKHDLAVATLRDDVKGLQKRVADAEEKAKAAEVARAAAEEKRGTAERRANDLERRAVDAEASRKAAETAAADAQAQAADGRLQLLACRRTSARDAPSLGLLYVEQPSALVYVDGSFRGRADKGPVSLKSGKHTVSLNIGGERMSPQEVTIIAGQVTRLR